MADQGITLAIIGATTALGESLVEALPDTGLPIRALHLVDADAAITGRIGYAGHYQAVEALESFAFAGVELVLFACQAALASRYIESACGAGSRVIDLSGASALASGVGLVVAGIHDRHLARLGPGALLACPDPVSLQLVRVLQPLLAAGHEVVRVDCMACRAATLHGKAGSEALAYETVQLLSMRQPERFQHGRQIAFNLLPVAADGAERVVAEAHKMLDKQELELNIRLVDSPVFMANSLQCFIDFAAPTSLEDCRRAWADSPALCWHAGEAPSAVTEAAGQTRVVLGGLASRAGGRPGLSVWSVADSLGGQAANALSVAEILVKSVL